MIIIVLVLLTISMSLYSRDKESTIYTTTYTLKVQYVGLGKMF